MSIYYFIRFYHTTFGYFRWGRLVDLAQRDMMIVLLFLCILYLRRIVVYQRLRWLRLNKS